MGVIRETLPRRISQLMSEHLSEIVVGEIFVGYGGLVVVWISDLRDPIVGVARISGRVRRVQRPSSKLIRNGSDVIRIVVVGVSVIDMGAIRMPDLSRTADLRLIGA